MSFSQVTILVTLLVEASLLSIIYYRSGLRLTWCDLRDAFTRKGD